MSHEARLRIDRALVDSSYVTRRPPIAVWVLWSVSLLVVVGSAVWAYSTFDFWESGPILGSIGVATAASAGALYIATRRVLPALLVALLVVAGHFVLLLAITLSRWEG
jgi:hypothetical protein